MASTGRRDDRSPEAEAYRALYRDRRWRGPQGVRTIQLRDHPLCAMCEAAGRVTPATVCDHVDPKSKLSEATFFAGPFQSLCDAAPWRCHSSRKQQQEKVGYHAEVDAQGHPTDPLHPWNRAQ
jgi:5-methylcytosine-specific restriction enzyme A